MHVNIPYRHGSPGRSATAFRKGALLCLVLLVVASLGLWLDRRQLLLGTAELWVVDDPAGPADAVAIFGGGVETRPAAAAELFRRGLARRILVSNVRSPNGERPSHDDQNLDELKKLGIDHDAVEIFGCDLSNTYQEALALRRWSASAGARSLVVPTEYFSARRVRWITERVFRGTGVEVRVPVISSLYYLRGDWWDHVDAPWAFGREVIKYVGYRLAYGLLAPWYQPEIPSGKCAS